MSEHDALELPALTLVKDEPLPVAPPPRPEAPRFVPRGGIPKPRESGANRAIPFPQSAPPAPSGPAAQPQDELAFLRSVTIDSPSSARSTPSSMPTALDRDERPSQMVAKTLKCGECGSLNRPTEWYCERCGAELAAL
jgi:hypothetical protein